MFQKLNTAILYLAIVLFVVSLIPNGGVTRIELSYGIFIPLSSTLWFQNAIILLLLHLACRYEKVLAPVNFLRKASFISILIPVISFYMLSIFPFSHPERAISYYDIGRFSWSVEHVICAILLILYFSGIIFLLVNGLVGAYFALKKIMK